MTVGLDKILIGAINIVGIILNPPNKCTFLTFTRSVVRTVIVGLAECVTIDRNITWWSKSSKYAPKHCHPRA